MTTLEKIRTEIAEKQKNTIDWSRSVGLIDALDIIDKYAEQEPCDDAIDRAEAQTEIMMFAGNVKSDEGDIYVKVSDAVQILRELPSVRPQEQTGHWINKEFRKEEYVLTGKCSACGQVRVIDDHCSNCGARMVEPQESEEQPLPEEIVEHYRKLAEHYNKNIGGGNKS